MQFFFVLLIILAVLAAILAAGSLTLFANAVYRGAKRDKMPTDSVLPLSLIHIYSTTIPRAWK